MTAMAATPSTVRTCLWLPRGGRAAAAFYVSLLPGSRIEAVLGAGDDPFLVSFTLAGTPYQILSHATETRLTEAASIAVQTGDQAETDRLWAALAEGGRALACGWLRDRFGVAWQIVPRRLMEVQTDPVPARAVRVRQAMMRMVKIDIAALEAAADGKEPAPA